MSKLMYIFLGILLFIAAHAVNGQAAQVREDGLAPCISYLPNGTEVREMYDPCTSFCCGGNVIANSSNTECCGSVEFGSPYNPRFETCCEWWTGHGMGHVRQHQGERISCCGAHRINWGIRGCCYGHPDPPEVFDYRTELCCNAHRVTVAPGVPVSSASCCGERESFDKRVQSCPCNNGQVLGVAASKSACCETVEGLKTAYIPATQLCCAGQVGEIGINFCCENGGGLGVIGDNVCCDGQLVAVVPPDTLKTECCNGVPFNPDINFCCDDEVMEIVEGADQCCVGTPYSPEKSICCESRLWSTDTQGTECCSSNAFFPDKGSFCCEGDVRLSDVENGDSCCGPPDNRMFYYKSENQFICCGGLLSFITSGDACCETTPYASATGVCCDGQVFDRDLGDVCCNGNPYFDTPNNICCNNGPFGPFKTPRCCGGEGYDVESGTVCCGETAYGKFRWPACCVDQGYDASTHVCCGATIYEIPNGSNQGSCCGNRAFDVFSQICCSGENITIPDGVPRSRAQCCNFDVYNTDTHLCCAGFVREKTDRSTRCCGISSYNSTERICCDAEDGTEPILYDFTHGRENTGCCGILLFNRANEFCCGGFLEEKPFPETACCNGVAFNRMEQICCENELKNIGRVPSSRAECCGSQCMFRGLQQCCNDRIYNRGSVLSNVTCETF